MEKSGWSGQTTSFPGSFTARWEKASPGESKRVLPDGGPVRAELYGAGRPRPGSGAAKAPAGRTRRPSTDLLQFGLDEEFLRRSVVLDAQDIRLAADLAIFHVALPAPSRLVDRSGVPFSAGSALESGFHHLRAYPNRYDRGEPFWLAIAAHVDRNGRKQQGNQRRCLRRHGIMMERKVESPQQETIYEHE